MDVDVMVDSAIDPSEAESAFVSRLDPVLRGAAIVALAFVCFVAGVVLTTADLFPAPQVARSYHGGRALYEQIFRYQDVYATDLWYPARTTRAGVTSHVEAQAHAGATLYTSGHDAAAFLIAMDGGVLHEWRRPFSTVWEEGSGIAKPRPDAFVYFRKVKLLDSGELLAIYEAAGDTPYGYGMVKLDRNSEVIWTYFGRTHHDFEVADDGRIFVLTHEFTNDRLEWFGHLKPPRLDDFLVVLSPDGQELAKTRLIDAVARSPYHQLLFTVSAMGVGDPLHVNDVDIITSDMVRNFPYGRAGEVLLSFRAIHAIAVFDPVRAEIIWAATGPWIGQHDPDILPNGNILLFDNFGRFKFANGESRVLEFNPRDMKIAWQYDGDAADPLESSIRSGQQRLANGNTLIVESNGGRVVEVTPHGRIVWEFINPVRSGEANGLVPIVASAERLDLDSTDFARTSAE
jgi:Arylsulfotransferase (ASST)